MNLTNITRKIKNVPGYLRSKLREKPFHWTMSKKEAKEKKNLIKGYINYMSNYKRNIENKDTFCKDVEEQGLMNHPNVKNNYKKLCLSESNLNVEEVNLNVMVKQLKPGNTQNKKNQNLSNLPMKNQKSNMTLRTQRVAAMLKKKGGNNTNKLKQKLINQGHKEVYTLANFTNIPKMLNKAIKEQHKELGLPPISNKQTTYPKQKPPVRELTNKEKKEFNLQIYKSLLENNQPINSRVRSSTTASDPKLGSRASSPAF